jgi:hypothetical protein
MNGKRAAVGALNFPAGMKIFQILADGDLRSMKALPQLRNQHAALNAQSFQDGPSTFFD